METLEMLGVALGLATLAGLNLYLTVFVTGLAVHFEWVVLPPEHSGLEILSNPWVIGVAGLLYFLEFFADKCPWVDSLNDTVHTAIRPIGGALIAVLALGEANPAISVIAALIGGGAAFTSHAAKATTRLVTNASPEPLSNIGLSLAEDATVLGGLALLALSPLVAGGIALLLLIVAWIFLPRLIRAMRATGWLAWRKLNTPSSPTSPDPEKLPMACEVALRRARATKAPVTEAAPCISGGGPRLPKHYSGWFVRFASEPESIYFVAPRFRGPLVVAIPLPGTTCERTTKFLCEILTLRSPGRETHRFLFERGHTALADALAEKVSLAQAKAISPAPAPPAQTSDSSDTSKPTHEKAFASDTGKAEEPSPKV